MAETKTLLELTALERFAHLEDKIFRVVDAIKAVRKENEALRAENHKLRAEVEKLRQDESLHHESVRTLQKEREHLRERVEKALGLLATVEMRTGS